MPRTPRLLAFAGSARKASFNKLAVAAAAAGARTAGAEVTLVDLRDWEMPLYDGDLEDAHGLPEVVLRFKALMGEHDGFLVACPEYNSSITPLLKNTIDWCSRAAEGEAPLACYAGKVVGLVAASPGALGGLRGLVTVRSILGNLRMHVIPEQAAVPRAHEVFDAQGHVADERMRSSLEGVGAAAARLASRLLT